MLKTRLASPILVVARAIPMVRMNKLHPLLLLSEDMLDTRPDLRFGVVGSADRIRHSPALRLLAMDAADEAVLRHERFVGGRPIGGVGPHRARRVGLVEKPLAQATTLVGGGVGCAPFADEAEATIDRDMVLVSKCRDRQIDQRRRAFSLGLALVNFTVQRASRSFWRSLAGLSFHWSGTRPSLIAFFSSSVLRWRGAATRLASTIWPDIAI